MSTEVSTALPRAVCIVGWGRSGSTLLDRMLGRLEGTVSVGEFHQLWVAGLVEDRLRGCRLPFSKCPFFWQEVGELTFGFGGW